MLDFKLDLAILLDSLGLGVYDEEDVNANIVFKDKESPETLIIIKNNAAPPSDVRLNYDNVGAQILIRAQKDDSSVETLANSIYSELQGRSGEVINGKYYTLITCDSTPYYFTSNIDNEDYYTINVIGLNVYNDTPYRRD